VEVSRVFIFQPDLGKAIQSAVAISGLKEMVFSDAGEIIEKLNYGDFIQGLSYDLLLKIEERLKLRLHDAHIVFTEGCYGFVSREWDTSV
jgi:hypothetical protein